MTINIPDGLPVLSSGAHPSPEYGACFMEFTALLAGQPFNDHPHCVDLHLGRVMQMINDRLNEQDRIKLVPLLGRAIGLVAPGWAGEGAHDYLLTQRALTTVASGIYAQKMGLIGRPDSVVEVFTRAEDHFTRGTSISCDCPGCGGGRLLGRLLNFRLDAAVKVHEAYEEAMKQLGWEKAKVEVIGTERVLPMIQPALVRV